MVSREASGGMPEHIARHCDTKFLAILESNLREPACSIQKKKAPQFVTETFWETFSETILKLVAAASPSLKNLEAPNLFAHTQNL